MWGSLWDILRYVLDFSIIAGLIYYTLYFLRGTRAESVLAGVFVVLISLNLLTKWLDFEVLSWVLTNSMTLIPMALIIFFQPELRRALAQVGGHLFHQSGTQQQTIIETVKAVSQMSRSHTGALIVFERQIGLASLKNTAVKLEAKVNSILLQSIFFPNSPLHDGALIIRGDMIEAGHAILPLTQLPEVSEKHLGTRHRAAIGVTEETDAIAIVVSEETGYISIAMKGVLTQDVTPDKLTAMLNLEILKIRPDSGNGGTANA